jgi:glycine betaine/proline transport system permease protein
MNIALSSAPHHPRSRRLSIAVGFVALLAVAQMLGQRGFPESWNINLANPINDVQGWVRNNRGQHWLFTFIFEPFTWVVDFGLERTSGFISWLPWFIPPTVVFLIIARSGKYWTASFAAFAVIYPGIVGVWEQSIDTVSLMTVSVALSVAIGIPIGVWTALNKRAESALRPLLDAMQTVPATVYLIPVVLIFGIGQVPAAIATIIYALPPIIRLTALGIQQVPASAVEAAKMFGATKRQTLVKVQLPLAVPSIIAGINQTVMMALGIVVIATLVGAGGLGQEIMQTVRMLSPGRGLVVGMAVVSVAYVLDRVSLAVVVAPGEQRRAVPRRKMLLVGFALIIGTMLGRATGIHEFPFSWGTSFADPVDTAVNWFRDTFDVVTRPFNDFLVRDVLIRARRLLNETLAWQLVVTAATALAIYVAGWKMALTTAIGLIFIGVTGGVLLCFKGRNHFSAVARLSQSLIQVATQTLCVLPGLSLTAFFLN